jgi:hypothetical protein
MHGVELSHIGLASLLVSLGCCLVCLVPVSAAASEPCPKNISVHAAEGSTHFIARGHRLGGVTILLVPIGFDKRGRIMNFTRG